jgi:CubicO group peptidase (beta-lactamase class C family)
MIAPELITRYSGASFESFVSTRLLAPLNMSRTTYNYTSARAAGLAHGFLPSGRRVPNLYADPAFAHLAAGAGGLMASAADLARWAAFLLGDGAAERMQDVRRALEDCMRPRALVTPGAPDTSTYGMGWGQMRYRGQRVRARRPAAWFGVAFAHGALSLQVVRHGGGLRSVSTSIALFPDLGVGLVQLAPMGYEYQLEADVFALIVDAVLERAGVAAA